MSSAAAERSTMLLSRQRQTQRVQNHMPPCGFSIMLVETRERDSLRDEPK
jgi:hypothetical protein